MIDGPTFVVEPRPHYVRIAAMRALSVGAGYVLLSTRCIGCAVVADIVPFLIAGNLHHQESVADRVNGWIKLGLIVAFYRWAMAHMIRIEPA